MWQELLRVLNTLNNFKCVKITWTLISRCVVSIHVKSCGWSLESPGWCLWGYHLSLLSPRQLNIMALFFLCSVPHYVSSHCDHCYSIHDRCVLLDIIHIYGCYNGFYFTRFTSIASTWCDSAALLIQGTQEGLLVGLTTVPQQYQPQSQMPSKAYANYAIGPPQVSFSFRVEPPPHHHIVCWCLLWCLLSAFRSHVAMFTKGAQLFRFAPPQPFEVYSLQAYVPPSNGPCPMPGGHWVTAPSTASSRRKLCATQWASSSI